MRLIERGKLIQRRNAFHHEYTRMTTSTPRIGEEWSEVEYDAEAETLSYKQSVLFEPSVSITRDFGKEVCAQIPEKTEKSIVRIYKQVTSGSQAERTAAFKQLMRDVEGLINIVSEQQVYHRYPCVFKALVSIKDFAVSHSPLQSGTSSIEAPTTEEEPVVSYQYKCVEAGSSAEDKGLTSRYLGDLFHKLRSELQLIAPDTSIEDFRAIFSGKVVLKPVTWTGTNKQLQYLFKTIVPKLKLPGDNKPKKWVAVAACFVHRNGDSFTASELVSTGVKDENTPKRDEIRELGSVLR